MQNDCLILHEFSDSVPETSKIFLGPPATQSRSKNLVRKKEIFFHPFSHHIQHTLNQRTKKNQNMWKRNMFALNVIEVFNVKTN